MGALQSPFSAPGACAIGVTSVVTSLATSIRGRSMIETCASTLSAKNAGVSLCTRAREILGSVRADSQEVTESDSPPGLLEQAEAATSRANDLTTTYSAAGETSLSYLKSDDLETGIALFGDRVHTILCDIGTHLFDVCIKLVNEQESMKGALWTDDSSVKHIAAFDLVFTAMRGLP
eukprot:2868161-Pyramimonas_sp.AAC.1